MEEIDYLKRELYFLQRQIEIAQSFSRNNGELSFLYYQYKILNDRINELEEKNVKVLVKEKE